MKNKFKRFMKSKWSKIFCCVMICCVFISLFTISASAAPLSYDTINFSFGLLNNGTIKAFPYKSGTINLYKGGVTYVSSLDLNSHVDSLIASGDGSGVKTFDVQVVCYNSSLIVNGVSYFGTTDYSFSGGTYWLDYYDFYSINPGIDSSSSVPYFYEFTIYAMDPDVFNEYGESYLSGFKDGVNSSESKNKWYPQGFESGYQQGVLDGVNSSQSTSFGQNLLGDTLSAPMKALNNFTLFVAPNGTSVTLGGIIGALIGLSLLLVFLSFFR